jgi:hypothetical protein
MLRLSTLWRLSLWYTCSWMRFVSLVIVHIEWICDSVDGYCDHSKWWHGFCQ